MTKEAKTRKAVKETTVVVEQEKTEFELGEEEIPGTRCDFCDQWYADEEPVEIQEMVENPSVSGLPDGPLRLYELLRYIDLRELTNRPEAHMAGSAIPVGYEYREGNDAVLLKRALKEYVESRGGPRDYSRLPTDDNLRESSVHGRLEEWDVGDILFQLDLELEVDGTVLHMCEYCRGSRKNE